MKKIKFVFKILIIVLLLLSISVTGVKIYQKLNPEEPAVIYYVEGIELDSENVSF